MTLRPLTEWILIGVLGCSLATNVVLINRVRQAQEKTIRARSFQPGEFVQALDVKRENGQTIRLDWSGSRATLVYYFSRDCGWCKKNAEAFSSLAEQVGSRMNMYSYSPLLSNVGEFRRIYHTVPVITDAGDDVRRHLRLTGTPQTLIIGPGGRIVKNWEGAYTESIRKEIEEYLHVQIPALPD